MRPTTRQRSAVVARRPNVALLVGLFLLPLWVDTAAMAFYLATDSAALYSLVIQGVDIVALLGLTFGIKRATTVLKATYGWWIAAPAALYLISLATSLISGSGNHIFMLAALRYTIWVSFIASVLSRPGAYQPPATSSAAKVDRLASAIGHVTLVLATLSITQLLFSGALSDTLQRLHTGFTPPERTNAVLTSLSLGKAFASLTLRNPIELSYVGVALLCFALSRRTNPFLVIGALVIVVCGRSNTAIIATLAIGFVHSLKGRSWIRRYRWSVALCLSLVGGLFVWVLPEIYLGPDSTWDDFIVVLTHQRLGMLLALPELLSAGGLRLLVGGMPTPLFDLVESLYLAGLLPELFSDGGAIAVFDIMWFGFLLVGGLPLVLGGFTLISLGFRRAYKGLSQSPDSLTLQLFCIGTLVLSFSSQILLSRYGLYFLCFFLAATAASQFQSKIQNPST